MRPMPERVSKFAIEKPLGRGAAGSVYLARDTFSGREVALKVLDPALFQHPAFADVFRVQFEIEASLAGKLNHPHIVSILDATLGAESGHIVMEYVPGGNLARYLKDQHLLPFDSAIEVAFKCCGALDYAYRHGIVHRDIKPANILVGDGTEVKIGDFGAAYLHQSDMMQTVGLGSPAYMSPEQIEDRPLTLQSDMFCLGVVLYELVTGQRPFNAQSNRALLEKIVSDDPLPPSRVRSSIPGELDEIVLKALRKKPEQRYETWADFALELATVGRLRASQQSIPDSEKYRALKRVQLLSTMSDPEIWALVTAGQWSRKDAGQVLIREGERSDRLYFLAAGEVKVTKRGRLLDVVRAGEFFGEMSFISGGALPRQATIESLSELVIAEFDRAALEQVQAGCQVRFLWSLLGNLVDRLAFADARLTETA
jgi:serine/threonine protein kinase